jgi:tRNA 2-thiouridine synthesizing protein A
MTAGCDRAIAPLVVDARGMRCPWPALRLARAMRDVPAVRLISDDPRAADEVAALADQHGWTVACTSDGGVLHAHVIRQP